MLKITIYSFFFVSITACSTNSLNKKNEDIKIKQPTQVLVLGMVHLGEQNKALSKNANALIKVLKNWKPTKIAIEDRLPASIYKASQYATFDDGYKKMIEIFDGKDIQLSQQLQKKHHTDYLNSLKKVKQYLEKEDQLSNSERAQLVLHLLVTFDVPSGILQWSKIDTAYKDKTVFFSKENKEYFDKILAYQNEIYSVAIPLAKEMNHPLLYSVDSQEDGVSMMKVSNNEMELLYANANSKTFSNSQFLKDEKNLIEKATKQEDLLSVIEFVNKNANEYDAQWNWFLDINEENGLHKLRYANWEQRNISIFNNIQKLASSPQRERVLVIIGASHKAILDRYFMHNKSVEVVHLWQLLEAKTDSIKSTN